MKEYNVECRYRGTLDWRKLSVWLNRNEALEELHKAVMYEPLEDYRLIVVIKVLNANKEQT